MGLKIKVGDIGTIICDDKGLPLVKNAEGQLVSQTSERVTTVKDILDGLHKNK